MLEYLYSAKDFTIKVDWKSWEKSEFDRKLEDTWYSKEKVFRYKLAIDDAKMLDGDFGLFAQLNINRAVNRRLPEDIRSIKQPFSQETFNFTKVKNEEIMFYLNEEGNVQNDIDRDYFLINVSPLEKLHSMLIPSLNQCLPQIVTEQSIYKALHTLLLSSSPELKVCYNGLCANASVNHLHLHVYSLNRPMKLETMKVSHLAGSCYTLEDYPGKGYVFQLTSSFHIPSIVRDIHLLTRHLTDEDIAHNLYFTRGLSFQRSSVDVETSERDCIRIYVWARKSSYGAKVLDAFNPAAAELFGHLVIKSKESFDLLTEAEVAGILESCTDEPFRATKERVKQLYS